MKRLLAILLAIMVIPAFTACSGSTNESKSMDEPIAQDAASEEESKTTDENEEPYNILVVIRGESSEFWQIAKSGSEAKAQELGSKVKVTFEATPTSDDYEEQIQIVEAANASGEYDAIVICPASAGTIAGLTSFSENGGVVIIQDSLYDAPSYDSFIVSDNYAAGGLAADAMVAQIEAMGKELSGTVGIVSSMGGIESLISRQEGFADRMAEIAPDIELLPIVYAQGDAAEALSLTQNVYLSNSETLLGIFGDADLASMGIARAVDESNLKDKFAVVTVDTTSETVAALENGLIHTIIAQNAYLMGADGVQLAVDALDGLTIEKEVNPPLYTVSLENLHDEEVQKLVNP